MRVSVLCSGQAQTQKTAFMNDTVRTQKKRRRGQPKGRPIDFAALAEVRELLGDEPRRRDLLLEHLHKIQDHCGCLPAEHLNALARVMKLSSCEVYEVASFYHHGPNTPLSLIHI